MTNKTELSENKALNMLKKHLAKSFEANAKPPKPRALTIEETQKFLKTIIEPAYKEIISQLSDFNFKEIKYNIFEHTATLNLLEKLSSFYISVRVDNITRNIEILYVLRYRTAPRKKLSLIRNRDTITISLRDIASINTEMIINLFSKWYINKDKAIEDHKAKALLLSQKTKN